MKTSLFPGGANRCGKSPHGVAMVKHLAVFLLALVGWVGEGARAGEPEGLSGQSQASLQKSLDQANGRWTVPAGRHVLGESLVWDLRKGSRLAIEGNGATLIMKGPGPALRIVGGFTQGNADPKNVPQRVLEKESACSIAGLRIEGDHPQADGMTINGTMELAIKNLSIRGCRHGLHFTGLNRNLIVDSCRIYNNSGTGIFFDQVNFHQSIISSCHISYCHGGGFVSQGGDVRNIQITGCDIEANMGPGSRGRANVLLDSTGGSVAEVAITGCTIQHSRGEDTANIRVLGKGGDAKKGFTREGHITITGNVLSDVSVNLDLVDCRGVSVVGNTFWMGYEHNLRVHRCSHIVVGANPMERNPRYDYGTSKETSNSVLFRECQDITVQGLHLHQANRAKAGLMFEDCQGLTMNGCAVLDCEPVGILFLRVKDSLVSGCRVRTTGRPGKEIQAIGCRDLMLLANNFGLPANP